MSAIVCIECGHRNAASTKFCGKCGSFLEWDGAPAAGAAAADGTATGATAAAVSSAGGTTAAGSGAAAVSSAGGTTAGGAAAGSAAGAAGLVTEAPKPLRPDQVGTRQAPTPVAEEPRPLGEGEIACRACGIGNSSDRRFCRACGARLAETVAPPKVSWWRRLLRLLFLKRAYKAGDRRRVVGNVRVWPMVALLLVILLVSVATVFPLRRMAANAVEAIRDRFASHVAVTPVSSRASSSVSGRQPALVYDGASNRYWAPSGAPEGAWIDLDLGRPIRLLDLILTTGVSKEKQEFLTQGRPHEIEVKVFTNKGSVETRALTLRDEPGGQNFTVKVTDAIGIRITIKSAYGMGSGRLCALAEVEIYARG